MGPNVKLTLNGQTTELADAGLTRLIDALRLQAGLTGTKEGCGEGECGACTVLVDGRATLACLTPLCQVEGAEVVTIEGLEGPDELTPLQDAFIRFGGAQCGICTPGMVIAARALLDENPSPTRAEIREGLAGCLCRCTGYQKIIDAVEACARERADG